MDEHVYVKNIKYVEGNYSIHIDIFEMLELNGFRIQLKTLNAQKSIHIVFKKKSGHIDWNIKATAIWVMFFSKSLSRAKKGFCEDYWRFVLKCVVLPWPAQ